MRGAGLETAVDTPPPDPAGARPHGFPTTTHSSPHHRTHGHGLQGVRAIQSQGMRVWVVILSGLQAQIASRKATQFSNILA